MSKGNNRRGNRETKKPKKLKEKLLATADFNNGRRATAIGDKKAK